MFTEDRNFGEGQQEPRGVVWLSRALGLVGSFIISLILLQYHAPEAGRWLGVNWREPTWVKVAVAGVLSLIFGTILARIEGTVWGTYFVIIGYLVSVGLVVAMVWRLLKVW
jgi:hypothetical protein